MEKITYIVSDKFSNFAELENVITIQDFTDQLTKDKLDLSREYHRAQGITEESLQKIQSLLKSRPKVNFFDSYYKKIDKRLVHKHDFNNVLITEPIRLTAATYISYLHINEQCAEMSDHVTGKHIQGMLLQEAARQLFIGVTESYFIEKKDVGTLYFIYNSINIKFKKFAFPLTVELMYKIKSINANSKNGIDYEIRIDFCQSDDVIATAHISFSTYQASHIRSVESYKGQQAIDTHTFGIYDEINPVDRVV